MTAFVRVFLCCNSCRGFFRDETIPQDESITEARRAAKRVGWAVHVVDGERRDYCADCEFGQVL